MRFLIPLLISVSAVAQPLTPFQQRPIALAGLANRSPFQPDELTWIFSDMPANINVTNWIDEHFSSVWTNGLTGATRPTNTATAGVHFSSASSQQLTNVGVIFGTTSTHFLVLKRGAAGGAFHDVLDKANDGTLEWLWANSGPSWEMFVGGPSRVVDGDPPGVFDMAVVSDGTANTLTGYTNGVPYVTNSTQTISGPWRFMGGIPVNSFFDGWVLQFSIRTNTAETGTQISARHTAATNKYGYSP